MKGLWGCFFTLIICFGNIALADDNDEFRLLQPSDFAGVYSCGGKTVPYQDEANPQASTYIKIPNFYFVITKKGFLRTSFKIEKVKLDDYNFSEIVESETRVRVRKKIKGLIRQELMTLRLKLNVAGFPLFISSYAKFNIENGSLYRLDQAGYTYLTNNAADAQNCKILYRIK